MKFFKDSIMALIEVALVLWIANCIATAGLAQFLGWMSALIVVVGAWGGIGVLCAVASIVDSSREIGTKQRVASFCNDMSTLLGMLFGILAFPLAYAVLCFRTRNREAEANAAMMAVRNAAE